MNVAGVNRDTNAKDTVPATAASWNGRGHEDEHAEWEVDSSSPIFDNAASSHTINFFPESSFFKQRRVPGLPSPAEIQTINEGSGIVGATRTMVS